MLIANLFKNPKTTAAGILALAATAGKCYLMATGKAPIDPDTISTALTLFSAGAGLVAAKDGKGKEVADTVSDVAAVASEVAPFAQTIQQTIEQEGEKAKADRVAQLTAQVVGVLPQQ